MRLLLPSLAFFLLGSAWAYSSPIGSGADDGFHLTSIWCAWGENDNCVINSDSGERFVPDLIAGNPPCYVTWPRADSSAQCIENLTGELVPVTHFNRGSYPGLYFFVQRVFVGEDIVKSIYSMRLFNVLIGAALLFWILKTSAFAIQRAILISWGVAIIPIGIFFIASNNPSSWAIMGIASFWAFYASLIQKIQENQEKLLSCILGVIFSIIISVGARWDSVFYIFLSFVAISLLLVNMEQIKKYKYYFSALSLAFFLVSLTVLTRYWNSVSGSFSIGARQESPSDTPNPIINLLLEFPSFFLGLFGGQSPDWVQRYGDLGRDYTYGAGWLEFNFPSLTAIFIASVYTALIIFSLRQDGGKKLLAIAVIFLGVVAIMVFTRAVYGFAPVTFFQPRYFVPIFIVILGVSLLDPSSNSAFFNKAQSLVITVALIIAGTLAWLATITRYAISPLASITNFDQVIEWWPTIPLSTKLQFFVVYLLVQSFWTFCFVTIPTLKEKI